MVQSIINPSIKYNENKLSLLEISILKALNLIKLPIFICI